MGSSCPLTTDSTKSITPPTPKSQVGAPPGGTSGEGQRCFQTNDHILTLLPSDHAPPGQGCRCLGFAYKELPKNQAVPQEALDAMMAADQHSLVFIGLIALMDPPKPEVPQAIAECRTAGVKVRRVMQRG